MEGQARLCRQPLQQSPGHLLFLSTPAPLMGRLTGSVSGLLRTAALGPASPFPLGALTLVSVWRMVGPRSWE